jgi:hypothetical protein
VRRLGGIPLASAGLLGLLAACGGNSTGPTTPPPIVSAQRLDSIYGRFLAGGTAADSETATLIATLIELGPAYGGQEASFLVTTVGGARQTWYGYTYEAADNAGDSAFYTAAFSDSLLTNVMLIAQPFGADATPAAALLLQDNFATSYQDSSITAYALQTAVGESCGLQAGLRAEDVLSAFFPGALCNYATLGVDAQVTFQAGDNLGALTSWSITAPGFVGPRLIVDPVDLGRVGAAPSRYAAAIARLNALFTNSSRHARRAL